MKRSEQTGDSEGTKALQDAVDQLCGDLPDRPTVWVSTEAIWYSWSAWSPALTRYEEDCAVMLGTAGSSLATGWQLLPWANTAPPIAEANFGRAIADQWARHASAQALGLVEPGERYKDLEPDQLLVDRTLHRLLANEGLDLSALIGQTAIDDRTDVEVYYLDCILIRHSDWYVWIKHDGVGAPTISCTVSLGSAQYDGDNLEIWATFPQLVAASAIGRSLGWLVETGLPEIDARRIRQIDLDEHERRGLPADRPLMRIGLESDRIALKAI